MVSIMVLLHRNITLDVNAYKYSYLTSLQSFSAKTLIYSRSRVGKYADTKRVERLQKLKRFNWKWIQTL